MPAIPLVVTSGPHTYSIDLALLTQTNHRTGKVRTLRMSNVQIPRQLLDHAAPSPPVTKVGLFGPSGFGPSGGSRNAPAGLFGVTPVGGLASNDSDSMFEEAEQVPVTEEMDFTEVKHCGHPITQYWDDRLKPTKSSITGFHYAAVVVHRLHPGSPEWAAIRAPMGDGPQLVAAFRVQNARLLKKWDSYMHQLKEDLTLDSHDGKAKPRAHLVTLYHGCSSPENLNWIAHKGFDVIYSASSRSINAYGHGVYFGTSPEISHCYCCKAPKELRSAGARAPEGSKVAFLSLMIVGSATVGEKKMLKPPLVPGTKFGRHYDTMLNNYTEPTIMVATDNAQVYPAYIVCFQ